ncbi:hypothetical protein BgiMline_023862 [Biomphalaria glabrata]|uniref:Uncharacterized protein LOC106069225 n=2 Tax=Biomphalaria TaxID=6525 RepID=A0A2C9L836_BIOGL|nr:uncharacterized protein LOC106069225 [Biomphalaria glabrata]KAI8759935.1 proprotein convertase subtilisin/kexin type 5-like [Biomphalaria glabrata]KAI8783698.1 proprotein convertase subtilisin/kexin type 5 [Biomphalaria glabrata]KAK0041884.1 proprotein convertase subtilisin/kexin type 5 [Biomphalaria pfeifferi]
MLPLVLFTFSAIFFTNSVIAQWNPCNGRPEGALAEIACWGYKRCENGIARVYNCPKDTVLERDSLKCVKIGTGNTACGKVKDCTGLADGNYPDLDVGCISFYACSGGTFMGRHYCDANLVYDRRLVACNYKQNVPAPCGTSIRG